MTLEFTLPQFERLEAILTSLRDEQSETRTEAALQRQELGQIREHLAKLNGRTARSEDRLTAIEYAQIEARGAWKGAVAVASAVGGVISWGLSKLAQ
jgi:chromosome segregation ATPase